MGIQPDIFNTDIILLVPTHSSDPEYIQTRSDNGEKRLDRVDHSQSRSIGMLSSAPSYHASVGNGTKVLSQPSVIAHWRRAVAGSSGSAFCAPAAAPTLLQPLPQRQTPSGSSSTTIVAAAAPAGKGFGAPKKAAPAGGDAAAPSKCPCGSGRPYAACCGRAHAGAEPAATPEALLRARFSAYALGKVDYLVATTHASNPERGGLSERAYAKQVKITARQNTFLSLKVGRGRLALCRRAASGVLRVVLCCVLLRRGRRTPCAVPKPRLQRHKKRASTPPPKTPPGTKPQIDAQEPGPSDDEAFISFTVTSRPNAPGSQGKPADTQRERSHFKREGGQWLYYDYK